MLVQVDSRAGLDALDGILAIDGLDGVFIGPWDLAADMGHLGDPGAPEAREAVLDALSRIRAAGRSAGVMTTDPGYAEACRDAGANVVGVGADSIPYAEAIRGPAARRRDR